MTAPDPTAATPTDGDAAQGVPDDTGLAEATRAVLRRRLADALRRVTTVAVGRPLSLEAMRSAAENAERLADAVEAAAGPGKAPRIRVRDGQGVFLVTSPMIGPENPVAP